MDYITLLIGLLIGLLVGYIGNQLIQKNKKTKKKIMIRMMSFQKLKLLRTKLRITIVMQKQNVVR
mgnify:CR=1 FL=1